MISEEYKNVLRQTRQESTRRWGDTGRQYVKDVLPLLQKESYNDILDYGAGHGTFATSLPQQYQVTEYDPGFAEKENNNIPRNFVVCCDVLEHIEPDMLESVLDDLQRCMLDKGYFVISCRPAAKILSDGRNAHLIVEDRSWWQQKLSVRFNLLQESWDDRQKNYIVYVSKKD